VLKFLKSVGIDILKDIIIPAVFISIICVGIFLMVSWIDASALETIGVVLQAVFLIGILLLFIGVAVTDLVKYLKRKWNEVK
jgi:hypothetical protein